MISKHQGFLNPEEELWHPCRSRTNGGGSILGHLRLAKYFALRSCVLPHDSGVEIVMQSGLGLGPVISLLCLKKEGIVRLMLGGKRKYWKQVKLMSICGEYFVSG